MLKPEELPGESQAVQPAAFRRLCVETNRLTSAAAAPTQPPSGGCVLKQHRLLRHAAARIQPPSGGCVLKLFTLLIPS